MTSDIAGLQKVNYQVAPRNVILKTVDLKCQFGGLEALRGVTLEVEENSIVLLLGRNGAGKSTFINCVAGDARLTSGTVYFNGSEITGNASWRIARKGIARTFQIPKPISGLSVFEYVGIAALSGGVKRLPRKSAWNLTEEILHRVGIVDRADAQPTELSTVELRRLELARALALRPKLLLLDEPLGGLSPVQIDSYLDVLSALRDTGLTVVAIDHSVRAVLEIADEVVFMERGSVVRKGRPREVLSDKSVIETYLGSRFIRRGFW